MSDIYRVYDYDKVKRVIEKYRSLILEASMGMYEDWFWTGQPIFKDDKYLEPLPSNDVLNQAVEKQDKHYKNDGSILDCSKEYALGGIYGSKWATPCLWITLKVDENAKEVEVQEVIIPCFQGDQKKPDILETIEQSAACAGGCLSGPVQDSIPDIDYDHPFNKI